MEERKLKVGEWVEEGKVRGIVKKIRVREKEVEKLKKKQIIVKNQKIIKGNVGKWKKRKKIGRIEINVKD